MEASLSGQKSLSKSLAAVADIPGWFDFAPVYDEALSLPIVYKEHAPIVEVGSFMGKSLIYLALALKERGMTNKLFAVDTWEGTPSDQAQQRIIRENAKPLFSSFIENLVKHQVQTSVLPIVRPSVSAAEIFEARSLGFVFIDGDHSYAAVRADMRAWLPKIASGGVIAGHDYDWGEVYLAVQAEANYSSRTSLVKKMNRCWWCEVGI